MRHSLITAAVILMALSTATSAHANDDLQDALIAFSDAGDLEKVRYLVVTKGAKVNSRSSFGAIALHTAARSGHLPVVKFLIEQGADINMRGSSGYTALIDAVSAGQLQVVKYLVSKRADLGVRTSFGSTALDVAKNSDNRAVYDFLWSIYDQRELLELLLEIAAKGKLHLIKEAMQAGVSVNIQSHDGITLLMAASCYEQLNVVKWLVQNGADIDHVGKNGVSALYGAITNRYPKTVKYLLDQGARVQSSNPKVSSVVLAAKNCGDSSIIKLIMNRKDQEDREKKYSDEYCNAFETRWKYRSSVYGSLKEEEIEEVIKASDALLRIKKAWINDLGDDSFDPINLRITLKGIDPTRENLSSLSPLIEASSYAKKKEVIKLINEGAKIDERNGIGETPLLFLAETILDDLGPERMREYLDCVTLLLEKGADINSADVAGWTPLMWVSFKGNKAVVKLLIDKGADPKIASKSGATALSIAESLGYENTAAVIKAASNEIKK